MLQKAIPSLINLLFINKYDQKYVNQVGNLIIGEGRFVKILDNGILYSISYNLPSTDYKEMSEIIYEMDKIIESIKFTD